MAGLAMLLYSLGRVGETGRLDWQTVALQVAGIAIMIYFVKRQLKLKSIAGNAVFKAPSFRLEQPWPSLTPRP